LRGRQGRARLPPLELVEHWGPLVHVHRHRLDRRPRCPGQLAAPLPPEDRRTVGSHRLTPSATWRATAPRPEDLAGAVATDEFRRNPYPVYETFLAAPGWRSPSGYRVFSRYEDVLTILRQPAVYGQ